MNVSPLYDYILIGSGPTALAAIRKLPINSRILVIDRGIEVPDEVKEAQRKFRNSESSLNHNREVKSATYFKKKSTLDVKTYWGSDFLYKDVEGGIPFESQSLGGFTKVWGATFFPASQRIFNKLNISTQIKYKQEISGLEKYIDVSSTQESAFCYTTCSSENKLLMERNSFYLGLGNSGELAGTKGTLYWERTRLAISMKSQSTSLAMQIGCVNCGLCQVGCPYGLTWDSSYAMKQEIHARGSDYVIGDLKIIYDYPDKVIVTFNQDGAEKQAICKRFLCTGGILSTSKILINSDVVVKDKIHDSQTVAVFGISLKGRGVPKAFSNVTFPEMSFLYQGKVYEVAMQLYSLNEFIAARINTSLAKVAFKFNWINWIIRRFFFIGLAYFDSNLSGFIDVDKVGLKVHQRDNKQQKRLFNEMRVLLKKKSLYIVPISKKFKVGGGYHFMGNYFTSDTWSDESDLLEQGFIKLTKLASFTSNSRIHVVDGSIQGFLPIGSVTLNSMALTSILVQRIIDFESFEH